MSDIESELIEALEAALEWIDACPPAFNRDWVDEVLAKAKADD